MLHTLTWSQAVKKKAHCSLRKFKICAWKAGTSITRNRTTSVLYMIPVSCFSTGNFTFHRQKYAILGQINPYSFFLHPQPFGVWDDTPANTGQSGLTFILPDFHSGKYWVVIPVLPSAISPNFFYKPPRKPGLWNPLHLWMTPKCRPCGYGWKAQYTEPYYTACSHG